MSKMDFLKKIANNFVEIEKEQEETIPIETANEQKETVKEIDYSRLAKATEDPAEEDDSSIKLEDVELEIYPADIYKSCSDEVDSNNDIFKVGQIISSLDQSLSNEAALNSTKSILNVVGIDLDKAYENGDVRINLLLDAKNEITGELQKNIEENENKIQAYLNRIQNLREQQEIGKAKIEKTIDIFDKEIENISTIMKFIKK